MKVQLLVSEWCAPCRSAEEVWQEIARKKAISFEVLDVGQPEGRAVVARLGVRTVPSTVIDGLLQHLGVPTPGEAMTLVSAASDRADDGDASHYVGLTLTATSAWFIASSVPYLVAAGAALVFGGGIAGDAPWRGAALHAFGLGFAGLFTFGLGEHLLPRFTGSPIRGGKFAWSQFWLAHAGTLMLMAGLTLGLRSAAVAGGALAWLAFALFAWRLAPVLLASRELSPAAFRD
ncbi:MAG: thioredoxin family protein [Burkholderiales bacterium]|jgi:thiol-disulfide isomerase/thioredoxin|nr:thioredoxin family protein [Burkholderiales bacterium]